MVVDDDCGKRWWPLSSSFLGSCGSSSSIPFSFSCARQLLLVPSPFSECDELFVLDLCDALDVDWEVRRFFEVIFWTPLGPTTWHRCGCGSCWWQGLFGLRGTTPSRWWWLALFVPKVTWLLETRPAAGATAFVVMIGERLGALEWLSGMDSMTALSDWPFWVGAILLLLMICCSCNWSWMAIKLALTLHASLL